MRTTAVRGALLVGALLVVLGTTQAAWAGAAEGKATYEKKCKVCHSIGGEGGPMKGEGGPLDGVGAKRDEAWLRAYVVDPKSRLPESKMPKSGLTGQALDDVIAFLLSLKK
jgi:cytochrome c2